MYNFKKIEKKWQSYWVDNKTFQANNNSKNEKYYILVEFPYPSGSGLHVGHVRSYTALDVLARKNRMQGYNVLFPMGWDAFGSPAEQYAIKNHIHPKEAVKENIRTFKEQIQALGISYDWSREFSTTDEDYYKWTQWQFLKFYEHGLAYKDKKAINWCPSCKVGLSNEDAAGGSCERCGTKVIQKEKEQRMLKMSAYADQLLDGLNDNHFQERIKTAQINWIGKSTGAEVDFKIKIDKVNLGNFKSNNKTDKMLAFAATIYNKFKEEDIKVWFNGTIGVAGYYGDFFDDPTDLDCGVETFNFAKARAILETLNFEFISEKYNEKFSIATYCKEEITLEIGTFDQDLGDNVVNLNGVDIPVPNESWLAECYRITAQKERRAGKNDALRAQFLENLVGEDTLTVYTTRPDTLYGVTFMVVAPEHPLITKLQNQITNMAEIKKYQEQAIIKSEFERSELAKDKTGVKLDGVYAINPVNNEKIQIWTSDYVMMNYGTGAIMAVPAHDERDYDFAKKFDIPLKQVIAPYFPADPGNEIKPDVKTETRNSIIVALKHYEKDEYLCLNWKIKDWRSFIVGGIEDGETIEEAALREVREETGYQNLEIEKILDFQHHSNFYAAHKDVNRYLIATQVIVKLKDGEEQEVDSEEKEKHTTEWIKKEDLINFVNLSNHKYMAEAIVNGQTSYAGDGVMINSDILNGIDNKKESIAKMIDYLEENKLGTKKTNYRLQDWVFSRQRFWGEPIPMIYCEHCGWVPVPLEELPVKLPDVAQYEPTDNGESPLATIDEWCNVKCPKCGSNARRETDTMPNWAGSSWYWLRYMDPHNDQEFVSQEALKYWGKVDWYNGGMEHATRHLLYARFWNQFLYNIGLVPNKEPFEIRTAHGMILGDNGEKMSKSKGNVVNPNDIVDDIGADALRTYEMFIGDYEKEAAWSTNGLRGCKRFLDRLWRLQEKLNDKVGYSNEVLVNKTIKKVSSDIENMKYNTAVSALMIMVNEYETMENITKDDMRILLMLLSPIAPHISEEINKINGLGNSLCESAWPDYDEEKTIDENYEMIVQVNGKVRGKILVSTDTEKDEMEQLAQEIDNVKRYIEGKEIVKIVTVPKKLVNIVIKM
ncbi:MAG: class I tRNA ligase family protein [Burkholderiales bacterium]|nr:class I tRNA ligase family protein [Burkholderiales bacterium]